MRASLLLAVSLFFLCPLVAGCSHTHKLQPETKINPAHLQSYGDKTLAIVFLEPAFKDSYTGSASGHTHVFANMRNYYEALFRDALGSSFKSIDFYTAEPEAAADFYAYPELTVDVEGSFPAGKCIANYTFVVKNGDHTEVARRSANHEYKFTVQSAAEAACRVCLLQTFEITDDVFRELPR
jgi:hypothetical protein